MKFSEFSDFKAYSKEVIRLGNKMKQQPSDIIRTQDIEICYREKMDSGIAAKYCADRADWVNY